MHHSSLVSEKDREEKFVQYDHVRLYGLDYANRLEQVGFNVKITNPKEFISEAQIAKYAVNPKENIYRAIKL